MNIGSAKKQLRSILKLNHKPVLLWSSPGIGKSSICKQLAEEFNWKFIDIRLPLLMPSDLLGLPFPDKEKNRAKWLYPDFFPEPNSKENFLILFDEIGNAPMTVQNGCYRIILDRSIGDHYKFPEGVRMVAASNRETDKSGVGKFNAALSNRFVHFFVEPEVEAWKDWAWKNGISEKVIGFLKFKEAALCKKPNVEDKAYPTPRTWEYVSDFLKAGITDEDVIAGTIGKGMASEFFSYIEVYANLPDINKILKGDKKVKVPSEPSTLYALSSSIVAKADKKNIENVFKYAEKMPTEFHILTIRDITRRNVNIFKAYSKFQKWLDKFGRFYDDEHENED
jgi:hypothetical protein